MNAGNHRRAFLKTMGIGSLGVGLTHLLPAQEKGGSDNDAGQETPRIRTYTPLGKTGLKYSDVGFGAINMLNPNVLRYAYDCGVNHFDTAEVYMRTHSETYLGQALKDVRDKVYITTKHLTQRPEDMNRTAIIQRVEESLKRLQTDYLDVALWHSVDDASFLDNAEMMAAYSQLKKDGKVRHVGFSTHNAAATLPRALEMDFWEVVLIIYNHMEGPKIESIVQKVHDKGIGTIAMKVFAGNQQGSLQSLLNDRMNYSQAAIRWTLGNPAIDCCIVTMSTFSHVEEYVAASGKPLQRKDLQVIHKYRREADTTYCRVSCRDCLQACPYGVAVNDVLRYAMYYEHYGMQRDAMQYYADLGEGQQPVRCADCHAPCQAACPHRLQVKERLLRSRALLA